jgi:hypothetical protein
MALVRHPSLWGEDFKADCSGDRACLRRGDARFSLSARADQAVRAKLLRDEADIFTRAAKGI